MANRTNRTKRGVKRPPRLRPLEEMAIAEGYEPGKMVVKMFAENEKRLQGWWDDLKAGRVPADLAVQHFNHSEARELFYKELASFCEGEERWMEFFHGKRQRIESTVTNIEETPDVTDEPYTEEDWQREMGLEAAGGSAKGSR